MFHDMSEPHLPRKQMQKQKQICKYPRPSESRQVAPEVLSIFALLRCCNDGVTLLPLALARGFSWVPNPKVLSAV